MKPRFAGIITALAIFAPTVAAAGQWPDRPIHFIVPFPAGSSTVKVE